MIVEGVQAPDIPMIWSDCIRWLQPALDRYPESPDQFDLLESLYAHQRQLWIAWDEDRREIAAAVITELLRYPDSPVKICRVPWVGGRDMRLWLEQFLDLLKRWARANDCRFMEGSGRRGWSRHGFIERGTAMNGLPILVMDLAEA